MSDIEILWIGEDGQWLVAEGHHDLDAFTTAADKEYIDTCGNDGEDYPSDNADAKHSWWRPTTREECAEAHNYLRDIPSLNYEEALEKAWKDWQDEGVMRFVNSREPGARPMTYIETGA